MRVPTVSPSAVAYYLRVIVDEDGYDDLDDMEQELIEEAIDVAVDYIAGQTGLQTERDKGADNEKNNDLKYAVKVLAAEMYDNRQVTAQYTTENATVRKIIDQHSLNLLPKE